MCPVQAPNTYSQDGGEASVVNAYPFVAVRIGGYTGMDLGIQQYIQGAMVDMDTEKISYAELYLRNLNPQMTDDVRWAEVQMMQLFMGYGNSSTAANLMGTFQMSNPKFEFGGTRRIVISGLGDGADMVNIGRRRVFENMTYDQIITEVVDPYGYKFLTNVEFKEKIPSVTQAGISDYEFLRELAFRAGTDFFVFGGTIFFMIPALKQADEPLIIDVKRPVAKSVAFSVAGEGQAALITSSPINPMTGEFEDVTTEFSADGVLDIDGKQQTRFQAMSNERVVYMDGRGNLLSSGALEAMVNAEGAKRKNIVKVSATVTGTPEIVPRKLVMFLSCGSRFAGPYYITKATHHVLTQGSDYVTTFEGVRASTGNYRQDFDTGGSQASCGGTPQPMRDASAASSAEVET